MSRVQRSSNTMYVDRKTISVDIFLITIGTYLLLCISMKICRRRPYCVDGV